ncbi:hypothetical protein evm_008236 [Chilo suppressalis]|nr:hypothetical protein evm_008236 [Chilo suppressalis]
MQKNSLSRKLGVLNKQLCLLQDRNKHSCSEYCSHLWDGSAKYLLDALDRRRGGEHLEPLQLRRDVASLSAFYRLCHGECSEELFSLIPPSPFLQRTTRAGIRCHRLTAATIPTRTKKFGDSFLCRTIRKWNALPSHVFPPSYNLGSFKRGVKKQHAGRQGRTAVLAIFASGLHLHLTLGGVESFVGPIYKKKCKWTLYRALKNRAISQLWNIVLITGAPSAVYNHVQSVPVINSDTADEDDLRKVIEDDGNVNLREDSDDNLAEVSNQEKVSSSENDIHKARTTAAENLVKQAKKMKATSDKSHPPANIGDNVTIPIPDVDKGKGDLRNIIGVILQKNDKADAYVITSTCMPSFSPIRLVIQQHFVWRRPEKIEEYYNKENDKVYAHSSKEATQVVGKVQCGHYPALVMQNSAPGYKARTTQAWSETNDPNFIRAEDWPTSNPDLNPLDFKLWSVLEDIACSKRHGDIESLQKSLEQAVAKFQLEIVRKSIDSWPNRLKGCPRSRPTPHPIPHTLYPACEVSVKRSCPISDGPGSVNKGSGAVNDGSGAAIDGPGSVNKGSGAVNNGSGAVNNGPGAVSDGPGSVNKGSGSVNNEPGAVSAGPGSVNKGSGAVNNGPGAVSDGPGSVSDGPRSVNKGSEAVNNGAGAVNKRSGAVNNRLGAVSDGLGSVNKGSGAISPIYLAEISDKEIRGLLTLSSLFMFHVGSILMGVIKDVMTDALKYMPVLPVLFFIVCWFIPETPYFTLKEGKVETAKTILMKLRKYKDDRELVEDLKSIRKDVKTETLRSGSLKELITRWQYRKAVIICIGLKLIQELSGGNLFHSCRYIVMPQSKINMKATTANSIFGGLQIVSVIVSSLLVDRVGRRPLLIGSYLGAGCALAITAAYSYDFEAFKIDKDDIFPYGQVLIVGITLAAIFSKIGYNSLIYVIPAEMFPMNVKSVAMTALNVFGELSSLAIQQLFWKLMSLNSFFRAITMFATISLVGCVFSIYLVPETKGKSLREILITLQGTAYNEAAENLNEVTTIEMSKNEDNELLELKSAGHK